MPTVIVLDVSLSMTRELPGQAFDDHPQQTYFSLAVQGIHKFLDYLAATSRLEHVSLVSNLFNLWLILAYNILYFPLDVYIHRQTRQYIFCCDVLVGCLSTC